MNKVWWMASSAVLLLQACGGGAEDAGATKARLPKISGEYCALANGQAWVMDFRRGGNLELNGSGRILKVEINGDSIATTEDGRPNPWTFKINAEDGSLLSNTAVSGMRFTKDLCSEVAFLEAREATLALMKAQKEEGEARAEAIDAERIEAAKPPPPLLTPVNWWPKTGQDGGFHPGALSRGETAKVVQRHKQATMSAEPFRLFLLSKEGLLDENYEPVWVWWTALQSCARAETLIDDLTSEFGDKPGAKVRLAAARADFLKWSATQPDEIKVEAYATLGEWNPSTSVFAYKDVAGGFVTDWRKVPLNEMHSAGAGVIIVIQRSNDDQGRLAAMLPTAQKLACASSDGTSILEHDFGVAFDLWFGTVTPNSKAGRYAGFTDLPLLPAITMSREEAASFSEANPERKVILKIVTAATDESWTLTEGRQIAKHGLLRSIEVLSTGGDPIARVDY